MDPSQPFDEAWPCFPWVDELVDGEAFRPWERGLRSSKLFFQLGSQGVWICCFGDLTGEGHGDTAFNGKGAGRR